MSSSTTILRILHMEDELSLRDIVHTTLMVLDPQTKIVQFEDSDAALTYIEAQGSTIDLFLLDVRVPGSLDGIGVARTLRERGCKGIVAFTSAYAAPDTKTLSSLDYLWLAKPVELNRMRSTLKLARARLESRAAPETPPTDPPSLDAPADEPPTSP